LCVYAAELIGLPYLPPYAIPFAVGRDIINGVNFASAAGGILEQSGQALVFLFPPFKCLKYVLFPSFLQLSNLCCIVFDIPFY